MDEEKTYEQKTEEELQKKKKELENSRLAKPTTPLEEAREVNRIKEELLKREEELQDRREKFQAEVMVGGRAEAGSQPVKAPEMTDVEYYEKAKSGKLNVKKE